MELTVDCIPGPKEQQQSGAEYLKSQLKKIGIAVPVRAAPDFPTWAGRVSSFDFELTMDVAFNWGDPVIGVHHTYLSDNIRKGVIWSNTQQDSDARVDALLNAAAVEQDADKRAALYSEFQQIVATDLSVYWINALPYHTAYDKRLQTHRWASVERCTRWTWCPGLIEALRAPACVRAPITKTRAG